MRSKMSLIAAAIVLNLVIAVPVMAAAPSTGRVFEGGGVPGLGLGETRVATEAAFGEPSGCRDLPYYSGEQGVDGICDFPVDGGGQVTVHYEAASGGPAKGSRKDVVFNIRWTEPVSGWTTTAGVNTTLATQNPDAVMAAYPEAEVVYNPTLGNLVSIRDAALGIAVNYQFDYLSGSQSVTMSISAPQRVEPPQASVTRVDSVELTARKIRGQREVRALVLVRTDQELAAAGAVVSATWLLPDGGTQSVEGTVSDGGFVSFALTGGDRGVYVLSVDEVVLEGYEFDRDGSTLSASLRVK